jgi:hypothetical protein
MILPTRHIKPEDSLLIKGYEILTMFEDSVEISFLWKSLKKQKRIKSYSRLLLILTFLNTVGCIELKEDKVVKTHVS